MTAPVPEEERDRDVEPLDLTVPPADEHASELPDESDAAPDGLPDDEATQQENAGSSEDQPSQ